MSYDSTADTLNHIKTVSDYLLRFASGIMKRARVHDQSKLFGIEKKAFDEQTPKLKELTYGSEEYKRSLALLEGALAHHYQNNRHHPEHFPKTQTITSSQLAEFLGRLKRVSKKAEGSEYAKISLDRADLDRVILHLEDLLKSLESSVCHMTLLDLVEMLADWKAATLRHKDGDILKSINHNVGRFGLSGQLEHIFVNTVKEWDGIYEWSDNQ